MAAALFVIGATVTAQGYLKPLDNKLAEWSYAASPQKTIDHAVLFAIDTESLQADRRWPWPRSKYAELISKLEAAGAEAVVIDLDFSSPGINDPALAAAIEAASIPIFLPSFRQPLPSAPDIVAEMSPIESFAAHARVVNTMFPVDRDGVVRRMEDQDVFSWGPVPHVAFAASGQAATGEGYLIDSRFDRKSLPVLSFQDGLQTDDLSPFVQGKTAFIGATAIELGDEFVLPQIGLIPGVYLNVIAFEAVTEGALLKPAPVAFVLLLTLAMALAATPKPSNIGIRQYAVVNVAAFGGMILITLIALHLGGRVLYIGVPLTIHAIAVLVVGIFSLDRFAADVFRHRMNLQKHSSLLEAMLSANSQGIFLVNRLGLIENVNQKAADLLGVRRESLMNAPLSSLTVADELLGLNENDEVLLTLRHGDETIYADASRLDVALPISRSPYEKRQNERKVTVYTLHDLTDAIAAREAERRAKEAFAEASNAKSVLIDTMSHELRTPLNSIIGFAELIDQEAYGAHSHPDYKEFGGMIQGSGRHLLRLVNDMLLAGQLQGRSVELRPQPCQLNEVIDRALSDAASRQYWTNPDVRTTCPAGTLPLDRDLIGRALGALIDNAGKFAGANGHIEIEVQESEDKTRICVRDDGPGFQGEDPSVLVGLFTQADGSRTRTTEGSGLGLYLSNEITSLAGGKLHLSNRPEGGFEAILELPGTLTKRTARAA